MFYFRLQFKHFNIGTNRVKLESEILSSVLLIIVCHLVLLLFTAYDSPFGIFFYFSCNCDINILSKFSTNKLHVLIERTVTSHLNSINMEWTTTYHVGN